MQHTRRTRVQAAWDAQTEIIIYKVQTPKVKASVQSPGTHITTYVFQTLLPLAADAQQPATIDSTLDLFTEYPFRLNTDE